MAPCPVDGEVELLNRHGCSGMLGGMEGTDEQAGGRVSCNHPFLLGAFSLVCMAWNPSCRCVLLLFDEMGGQS